MTKQFTWRPDCEERRDQLKYITDVLKITAMNTAINYLIGSCYKSLKKNS